MKFNIIVNPTPTELKRRARECLYTWDEIKGTITEDALYVWFDDIHHVDLMNVLKVDYNERYDIVLHMNTNKVIMTKLYDRNYTAIYFLTFTLFIYGLVTSGSRGAMVAFSASLFLF